MESNKINLLDETKTLKELRTPCYIVDRGLIESNLKILKGVIDRTGARILLAQKAFSMYHIYPLISEYLCGATASGLYEARLCSEEMKGKENHIFSPAYREDEFEEILTYCDHIVFNSWKQVKKYALKAKKAGKSIGLRINPEISTQEDHEIYDPCAKGSRLGVTYDTFVREPELIALLDGIHFHTLCEQNADSLEITLNTVEQKFAPWLKNMKWINFGGGHHITREDYDIGLLEKCIHRMQNTYGLMVYLEPGEAVALNAGYLLTTVLETLKNEINIAILDVSAACHMPDVLEMPYRPPLQNSGKPQEKAFTYRLGSATCLAGDIIGDYSFDTPLNEGDKLVFEDMAIYSMVKNNTFNGMRLPDIVLREKEGSYRVIKQFSYQDFKERL